MKTSILSKPFLIFTLMFLWTSLMWGGNYNYSELTLKNYDEMLTEVKERINEAERIGDYDIDGAKIKLRDALQLVLSRPDSGNMVSSLTQFVRTPLRNIDAYESTLSAIINSAITMATDKNAKGSEQATALIILDNFISEFKPESSNNEKIKRIYEIVRDAKIKASDKAKNEFRMRSALKAPKSPSESAQIVIDAKSKKNN